MGHPQPPTAMKTDNQTATGILNGTIKQRRSKAIDMRFYWLKDRQEQDQFDIKWVPGKYNLADYFTKHHPGSHHRRVQPIYLYEAGKSPTTLQGCVEILDPKVCTTGGTSESKIKYQVMSTLHSSGIRRDSTATRVMLSQHSPGQQIR